LCIVKQAMRSSCGCNGQSDPGLTPGLCCGAAAHARVAGTAGDDDVADSTIHLRYTRHPQVRGKVRPMAPRTFLLRVLLSVALICNGATSAMASVQMLHASRPQAAMSPAAAATTAAMPPCHQHPAAQQGPAVAALTSASPVAAADVAPAPAEQPQPDCCKSGMCRCACAHPAQAAVPMMALTPLRVESAGNVRSLSSAHAAPALPHLIRPPIG